MRNVITNGMPSTVDVGGIPIEINTDFRHCLQVSMMVDDPTVEEDVKLDGILWHLFGYIPDPGVKQDYIDSAREFLKLGELDTRITKRTRRSQGRTFCWDADQKRLVADFYHEYRIDLTDEAVKLHWWLFLILFENLSAGSATMTAIGVRSQKPRKGATDEERAHIRALKKEYELPPRSRQEIEARDRAIWGD